MQYAGWRLHSFRSLSLRSVTHNSFVIVSQACSRAQTAWDSAVVWSCFPDTKHVLVCSVQTDANNTMHALHLLINAAISNREVVRLGQQPCMLTFEEFDAMCTSSSQVLQALLVFQDELRKRFFGKQFWVTIQPVWARVSVRRWGSAMMQFHSYDYQFRMRC